MRLPGGRQAQPGVATGQNVLAWRLGYAEVFAWLRQTADHNRDFWLFADLRLR